MEAEQPVAQLREIAGLLEAQREKLVEDQEAALSSFPEYRQVPKQDLRNSLDRNVTRLVAMLSGQNDLSIIEDERETGIRREAQQVPADVVLAGYRAVTAVLRDAFLDEAAAHTDCVQAALGGVRRLWELSDHYSSELVAARHEAELQVAKVDERSKVAFIRRVLERSLTPPELAADSEATTQYGITAGDRYWVIRAHAPQQDSLLSVLEQRGTVPGFRGLACYIDQDVSAIVGCVPSLANAPECTVAIAGPVYPDQLGAAFSEATGTLQSALVFDKRGLVTADQIGILQAVADYPQVAQRLEARYVTPIQANVGKPDEILDSVWAYLQCQRSIKQASVALSIHVNTLRYRLAKFESTVGAQLDDTQTLVEMWWVMQSRQRSKSTH